MGNFGQNRAAFANNCQVLRSSFLSRSRHTTRAGPAAANFAYKSRLSNLIGQLFSIKLSLSQPQVVPGKSDAASVPQVSTVHACMWAGWLSGLLAPNSAPLSYLPFLPPRRPAPTCSPRPSSCPPTAAAPPPPPLIIMAHLKSLCALMCALLIIATAPAQGKLPRSSRLAASRCASHPCTVACPDRVLPAATAAAERPHHIHSSSHQPHVHIFNAGKQEPGSSTNSTGASPQDKPPRR